MSSRLSDFAFRLKTRLGSPAEGSFFEDAAVELFRLQAETNAAWAALLRATSVDPARVQRWDQIPAVSTLAFRDLEVTSLPPDRRIRVFHSSGTTGQRRSRHYHDAPSLDLYEASLVAGFRAGMWGGRADLRGWRVVSLTPRPDDAPQSSLVHMIGTLIDQLQPASSAFCGRVVSEGSWQVDLPAFEHEAGAAGDLPVLVFGTAFNVVHLLEAAASGGGRSWRLPAGSRVMETGGYKGRSRELSRDELHAGIASVLGVEPASITCEYGMSELSSQAYDGAAERRGWFRFPWWARAVVISPETGGLAAPGTPGLLRVLDLANVWSAMAVQTQDLAVADPSGAFRLLGRAATVEPRGCSLMATGDPVAG